MSLTSVNPLDDTVLATLDTTGAAELEDALAAAAPILRAASAAERGRWMRGEADALDRCTEELVKPAGQETGRPQWPPWPNAPGAWWSTNGPPEWL